MIGLYEEKFQRKFWADYLWFATINIIVCKSNSVLIQNKQQVFTFW